VVIRHYLMQAGSERRCAPILLDNLANEPDPLFRAMSAVRLSFTDVDPRAITPALNESAHRDSDRSVRASARYALRLVANRQSGSRADAVNDRTISSQALR
jgi:hypothetical protein